MKTLGIILLVAGIIMTVFTGFVLITKEEVVDLGAIEIKKEEKSRRASGALSTRAG
jgi:hypothetical protein